MKGQVSIQYILLVALGVALILFSISGFISIHDSLNYIARTIDAYRQSLAGGFGG